MIRAFSKGKQEKWQGSGYTNFCKMCYKYPMRILIVGGGIGGLTTAIALQQQNIDCQIFEAAPTLNPVGTGLWLSPNALQLLSQYRG